MSRPDDALRRITQERLHAVARPGGTRPDRYPSEAAVGGDEPGPDPRHRVPGPQVAEPPAGAVGPAPSRAWPPAPVPGSWTGPAADDADDDASGTASAAPGSRHAADDADDDASGTASAAPGSRHAADDVRDVVERMRREALGEVAAQYSRRHGHPLDHPGMDDQRGPRRWFLTVRHAVVAGVAVAVLTAGVVVRATAEVPETVPPPGGPPASGPAASAPPPSPGGTATGPSTGPVAAPGRPGTGTGAAASGPGTTAPGSTAADPAGGVVVHVVGQVRAPGLVELPAGARVADAVDAAGGVTETADLSGVNLARVLVDGEQIAVPAPGEAPASVARPGDGPPVGGASGSGGPPGVVDLNVAGLAELDALPGIGPVIAQRILDWRAGNGPFRDVEELGEVAGIGDTLLGRLRPLVVV